ncbi:MAG: N-acetylmuramoyl-L-alanine amidase [Sphingomonadales bacterium]|jgi:N-acetylmuramoyl-L-alanine amidase
MSKQRKVVINFRASPNFDERVGRNKPNMLIFHYTGMETGEAALNKLLDPSSKVSAHYLVFEDGKIIQLVEDKKRAWHSGVSTWKGKGDINSSSIGIEIVNRGHEFGYCEFPKEQVDAVLKLSKVIIKKYKIPPNKILGHSDIAPLRKTDPGELFPWESFAKADVGIWPRYIKPLFKENINEDSPSNHIFDLQKKLVNFGFEKGDQGVYCPLTRANVTAFQRHWNPLKISGIADAETQNKLDALLIMHD